MPKIAYKKKSRGKGKRVKVSSPHKKPCKIFSEVVNCKEGHRHKKSFIFVVYTN
jgi:hypothetical protein